MAMPKSGFLNSKGFGGNNATGTVVSPRLVAKMLQNRYGKKTYAAYLDRNAEVGQAAQSYDQVCMEAPMPTIYRFGEAPLGDSDISITNTQISVDGFDKTIDLTEPNPYPDMFK